MGYIEDHHDDEMHEAYLKSQSKNKSLKIIELEDRTVLKDGRKIYAEISLNPNKDYNWVVYFRGGVALSGYQTKELAISRANRMFNEWNNTILSL